MILSAVGAVASAGKSGEWRRQAVCRGLAVWRGLPSGGPAIGPEPPSPRAPQVPVPNFGMQPANKLQHPPDTARTARFLTLFFRHPTPKIEDLRRK